MTPYALLSSGYGSPTSMDTHLEMVDFRSWIRSGHHPSFTASVINVPLRRCVSRASRWCTAKQTRSSWSTRVWRCRTWLGSARARTPAPRPTTRDRASARASTCPSNVSTRPALDTAAGRPRWGAAARHGPGRIYSRKWTANLRAMSLAALKVAECCQSLADGLFPSGDVLVDVWLG